MQTPILHLNGSGRERLLELYKAVDEKLGEAMLAMQQASPHGRDYYPLGDEAYKTARKEHEDRLNKLIEVANENRTLMYHVAGVIQS